MFSTRATECMGPACAGSTSSALSAPALQRDLRQDRHRDLFWRDGAEVEAGRGLDAVERARIDALFCQLFAQRRHLAAAADEGVIGGLRRNGRAQRGFVALALRGDHDKTPRL